MVILVLGREMHVRKKMLPTLIEADVVVVGTAEAMAREMSQLGGNFLMRYLVIGGRIAGISCAK